MSADPEVNLDEQQPDRKVVAIKASSIQPRSVRWLWEGRLPVGALSLLCGREGHGKSSVAYEQVARITRGQLPGDSFGKPRDVLIAATEDSKDYVIVPRLTAAGADLDRVRFISVITKELADAELSLPDDLAELERLIFEKKAALLLLDPIISRLGSRLDTHKDAAVRQALEPLAALCDRTGCSVLGIIHLNKTATTDPLTAIMGSRAFAAAARSVLFVAQDGDDRLLSVEKNNYGPRPTANTFRVEGVKLDAKDPDGRDIFTSRVVWTGETTRTARDVLAEQHGDARIVTPRDKAANWLNDRLKDGAVASSVLKAEAEAEGIPERTLKRAAGLLGVVFKTEGVFPRKTVWELPSAGPIGPIDSTGPTDPTGPTERVVDQYGQSGHSGQSGRTSELVPTGDDGFYERVVLASAPGDKATLLGSTVPAAVLDGLLATRLLGLADDAYSRTPAGNEALREAWAAPYRVREASHAA